MNALRIMILVSSCSPPVPQTKTRTHREFLSSPRPRLIATNRSRRASRPSANLAPKGGFAVDATEDASRFHARESGQLPRRRLPQHLGRGVRRSPEGGVSGLHSRRRRAGGRAPRDHHAGQVAVVRRPGRRREVRRPPRSQQATCRCENSRPPCHQGTARSRGAGPTSGTTSRPIRARGPTS